MPRTDRRRWVQAALGLAAPAALPGWAQAAAADAPAGAPASAPAGPRKVLRLSFNIAETTFDPARVGDLYSRSVNAHIFEALYAYDPLARPSRLMPLLAVAMPEVADDFRRFTVRLRRGIFFADDPAFGGKPRECVAADIAYALQRIADPANLSPLSETYLGLGILGLAEAREAAIKGRKAFDYDRPLAGLVMPDAHTLVIRTAEPRPRLAYLLADPSVAGAQARELVQHYGERIGEHPVGTGPFRLKSWRRSSSIVLERNPGYRERFYEAQPAPDDAEGQAILAGFKGRRLPMVDEVDISIVGESQPRWLSFLNGQVDALAGQTGSVPAEFVPLAAPGGKLAPNLAKRGMRLHRVVNADCAVMFFNMRDATVGGYTPEQVALRRAISLAYDVRAEVRLLRRGQATVAQSPVLPHCLGYDPAFKSEMGDHDLARANALLDVYGFADHNRDGWRERPDGSPLELVMNTETSQSDREYNDLWLKSMRAVGIRMRFEAKQWAENYKAAEAGTLQMWMLGVSADQPDGVDSLSHHYSKNIGSGNFAGFVLPAFDRVFERLQLLPDGPEREALFRQAKRLATAYMPYRTLVHRISVNLLHPWVIGWRRPVFNVEWWHLVDLDVALRAATVKT